MDLLKFVLLLIFHFRQKSLILKYHNCWLLEAKSEIPAPIIINQEINIHNSFL